MGLSMARLRHWFHHFVFSVWKKRPLLLAVVMVAALVVLAFQYHTVSSSASSSSLTTTSSSQSGSLINKNDDNNNDDDVSNRNRVLFGSSSNKLKAIERETSISFSKRNLSATDLRKENFETRSRTSHAAQANNHHFANGEDESAAMNSQASSGERSIVRADERNPVSRSTGPFIPQLRVVHFDLKGAPPRVSYFKQILPLLKAAGANAILLEYEERFPFWGPLQSVASPEAYSKDDVEAILELARIHDFEIIPLVQTFGHLEFVLKLEEFRYLREVDTFPMALCPSKNDSFTLIMNMIDQVMIFHPKTKWLHIGCDEVFHMGYCDQCRLKDRDTIFFDHVSRVARYVREKYGVIPIIWDDMLRNMSPDKLRDLGPLVEPMIWTYVRDIYRFIPYSTFSTFAEVFNTVWAASAFKGAFGETLTVPNAKMHLENNEAWLQVMAEQHKNFRGSFRGIVITGWQRYDHLANLCELLPAGLPSLILNLLTVSAGRFDGNVIFQKFDQIMQCSARSRFYSGSSSSAPDLDTDPNLWLYASSCTFPGSNVFRMTQHTSDVIKRVNEYIYDVTVHKAWMTDYSLRHNMSNPFRVDEALSEHTGIYYSLTSLVREAEDALTEVFDKYTVSEWIEQNIYPYIVKMEKVMKDGIELKKARTWPRRPLPMLRDLQRFLLKTREVR